jgi:hypothetical protein
MRCLYMVPMIHTSADMGSAAVAFNEAGSAGLSPEVWRTHRMTVAGFWASLDNFFGGLEVRGLMVYQDGLVAGGDDGIKIVREGAAQGSRNYRIIEMLLEKGAVLVQTESLALIKQEYGYVNKITRAKTPREKEAAALRYRLARNGLLNSRDEYIARRIGETLGDGETGVLFIGAYHDVVSRLDEDIRVGQIKDTGRVREYHQVLMNVRRDARRFRELGKYLTAPVTGMSFGNQTTTTSHSLRSYPG